MSSTPRTIVAAGLVIGLLAASGATCFATNLTPAEHACCALMAPDCGAADMDMSCCKVEAPAQQQAPASAIEHGISVPRPIAGPLALAPESPLRVQPGAPGFFDRAAPRLSTRAVHLVLSVFLI
jgi:hypothetical protein